MSIFKKRKKELAERSSSQKCKRCGKRPPANDDGLCDHCRFIRLMDKILEERE
jgi:ribosomal protein L37E